MKLLVQKLDPFAKLPSYSYEGDAGMDLFSLEDTEILPGAKTSLRTGIRVAIPKGYAGFVWDKSGLAIKYGLKTMAGVVDSGYRGEVMVALLNLGQEPYRIERGSKVAQLVIKPIERAEILEGVIGDQTERGERGFGSSGIKENAVRGSGVARPSVAGRPSWDAYFMMAAKLIAVMATCPKLRVGSVVVKDRRIVSSGFNGAPPGHPHCTEVGCLLIEGEGSSCRRVIHSEHNAVLQDSRAVEGGVLYTPYLPCMECFKAAIGARISEVVYEKEYKDKEKYRMSKELAAQSTIKLRQIPEVNILEVLSAYYSPKGSEDMGSLPEF